jgi:hypothetical protein
MRKDRLPGEPRGDPYTLDLSDAVKIQGRDRRSLHDWFSIYQNMKLPVLTCNDRHPWCALGYAITYYIGQVVIERLIQWSIKSTTFCVLCVWDDVF